MGLTFNLGRISPSVFTDSSLNVGIGAAPSGSYKLEVTGTAKVSSTLLISGAATFSSSVSVGGADQGYQLDVKRTSTGDSTFDSIANFYKASTNATQLLIRAKNGLIDLAGSYVVGGGGPQTALSFSVSPSGGSPTEAMRITSTGNVGIGTNTPTAYGTKNLEVNGSASAYIIVKGSSNAVIGELAADGDVYLSSKTANNLIFRTTDTERMRITSGGFLKAKGSDSTYFTTNNVHELRTGVGNDYTTIISSTAASPYGVYIAYPNANPNGVVNEFFICADNIATRVVIRSNGGLANYQANNVNLSDERTKKDIIPLESYWDKFKAIQIVKFKYKDQTHDDFNIGVIAQQVEAVAPEFVDVDGWNKAELDEDGNKIISDEEPLKAIYTADLHHATIKVLQEAMAKIEELNERLNKAGL